MRSVPIVIALGASVWLAAPAAQAVGFGRVATHTLLGQALNFGAAVRLEAEESLGRECVSAEVESGDHHLPSAAVRVSLEPGADATERIVRVTTSTLIDEPVVTVTVTVGCQGSVSRRFVSFIDPPAIALARVEPADSTTLVPQHLDSPVAPVMSATPVASGGDVPRRSMSEATKPRRVERTIPRERPRPSVVTVAATDVPVPPASPAARRNKAAVKAKAAVIATAGEAGARLKLDPAEALTHPAAASAPPEPPPTTPVVAAASAPEAAASAPADDSVAAEIQRLKALEDDVNRVRAETIATQRNMATLQARLREAEESRYANPLVYALAALSALLAVALAALWWRQSQSRGASPWWSPAPAPVARERASRDFTTSSLSQGVPAAGPAPVRTSPARVETVPAVMDERPVPTVTEDVLPRRVAAPAVAKASPPTMFPPTQAPEQVPRELSVEELIDLEQQAEFFIVLGQEEAAIDLLMSHLRSTGGASPLPYLKLLEIYKRRGDRDAYERIRGRFNRRFNAYAPDWDTDLQQGRSLADHPQLMAKIQSLWGRPDLVMPMLDAALLQRDELSEPFDLPACRDLLLLYSVARDLHEHEGGLPLIDLFLPLDEAGVSSTAPLDLDVSLPSDDGATSSFAGLVGSGARRNEPRRS